MDPPARNSMWRFGYPNAVNYDDNELFCGGYGIQWEQNEGKCGVCGDPYNFETPRPHEAGGLYAKGITTRFYAAGQVFLVNKTISADTSLIRRNFFFFFLLQEIKIEVELTANHQGHFEVYLCPNNNPQVEADQDCFDRYPLQVVGQDDNLFIIPLDAEKKGTFKCVEEKPISSLSPIMYQISTSIL